MSINLARIVHRLLTNPRGWSFREMERELGVKARMRRRYLQQLREDMPELGELELVRRGDDQAVRLTAPSRQEAGTAHEAYLAQLAALALAEGALRSLSAPALHEALDALAEAQHAWTSGQRDTHREVRARALPMVVNAGSDALKPERLSAETLAALMQGLVFRRPLRLSYRAASRGGACQDYEFRPLAMTTFDGHLYILAYKGLCGEERRLFRADRIDAASPMVEVPRIPVEVLQRVQLDRWFEGALGPFVTDAPTREVSVRFAPEPWVVATVRERRWHPTQRLERTADGRLLMTLELRAIEPLRAWLGRFGEHARLLDAA